MCKNDIRKSCEDGALRWTNHALVRLLQRNISREDAIFALQNSEIIEDYPTDYPYPSCLVLGTTKASRHLHVVCGIGLGELWIITAYYPNPAEWSQDFRTRREQKQ